MYGFDQNMPVKKITKVQNYCNLTFAFLKNGHGLFLFYRISKTFNGNTLYLKDDVGTLALHISKDSIKNVF